MKKLLFLLSAFVLFGCQVNKKTPKKTKLIVGIVIDQMRYDYLTRFANRYSENGFQRLLDEGFSLENAHYNLIPPLGMRLFLRVLPLLNTELFRMIGTTNLKKKRFTV